MAETWTRERFAAEVKKREVAARENPAAYRLQVGALAALGYAFIFLVAFALLASFSVVVVVAIAAHRFAAALVKVLIPMLLLLGGIARSLWVQFHKPDGLPLREEDAAPLFLAVERMTDSLGAPRFHDILLVPGFNASVTQWPRLGIFGWHKNYLLVGLPLMQALSREQFEAVLAHELGHLRGGHSRFGSWIYQVNLTWEQLLTQLGDKGATGAVLRSFFQWYAPYFAAASFALRRQDEYEADQCAARLTSPRTIADALCALPVYDGHLDNRYWRGLSKAVETSPVPPKAPYTQMLAFLRETAPVAEDADKALRAALREETDITDTHPSLSDRLKALGQEARLVPEPGQTAAEHYFGPHLTRLTAHLDQQWEANIRPIWEEKHKAASEARQRLDALDARAATETLSPEDAWWRAMVTENLRGEDEALGLYEALRNDAKFGAPATFAIGRILIERDDPAGIALLREVIARDPDATLDALGLIHAYEKRQGNEQAAKEIYVEGMRHADIAEEAEKERASVGNAATRYLPHDLDEATVARIRALVAAQDDVAEAFLVRKEVLHFPEKPLHVLGVTLTREWARLNSEQDAARLQQSLFEAVKTADPFPGEAFVIVMAGPNTWLKRSVESVPGARIYIKAA